MRGGATVDQILTGRRLFPPPRPSPRKWRHFALLVALGPLATPCSDTAVSGTRAPTLAASSANSAPAAYCVYELDPERRQVTAQGDTKSVKVKTSAKCPWTATTTATWMKLSTTSGVGNGEVRYTVERNTGPARQATILIGGPTHRVEQKAAHPVRVK